MQHDGKTSKTVRLIWLYAGSLQKALDSATWLATTRELRSAGWCVHLVTQDPPQHAQIEGVEVQGLGKPAVYLLGYLVFHLRFWVLLAKLWRQTDIVLFHSHSALWVLPWRIVRLLGMNQGPLLVMDSRTVRMEPRENESPRTYLLRQYTSAMNYLANRWADGQTAISPGMAEVLGIPQERFWGIWPSGVDEQVFACAGRQRRWPTETEPLQLIYIGSLHHERNLMALCRAVEAANATHRRFELTLAGQGTEQAELHRFAQTTGGRIRVLPPVPHGDVPHLLAKAHVGTLPFPDEEKLRISSPIKLFEYMAAGMPIFATRILCHTEVVRDGQYVCWAEGASEAKLAAALLQLDAARPLLPRMGKQAAAAVKPWTWSETAAKLRKALESGLYAERASENIHDHPC